MSNPAVNTDSQHLPDALKSKIAEWRQLSEWMNTAKKAEKELRSLIAAALFKEPKEGMNTLDLDGFRFKLNVKINRKLDVAALDSVMAELPEGSPARQLGVLIEYKPSLVLAGYRALPAEELLIFSQAVTETPGTPELDILDLVALDPSTAPVTPDWPAAKGEETPAPKKGKKKKEEPESTDEAPKKKKGKAK